MKVRYHEACEALTDAKLPVHEKTGVIEVGDFLGATIDGKQGFIKATNKRMLEGTAGFRLLI